MTDSRFDQGMKVRREVLGDEHVDRSMNNATSFDADFQHWITDIAWGGVWSRPGLDRGTRSLITVAILAAMGRDAELTLHLRASQNNGVTLEQIREMLFHVAVYAGVPAANHAFAVAKSALAVSGGESKR